MGIQNQRYICEDPFWPSVHPRPHSPPYPKGGISYCGENTVAGGNRGNHFSVPCSNSIWRDTVLYFGQKTICGGSLRLKTDSCGDDVDIE